MPENPPRFQTLKNYANICRTSIFRLLPSKSTHWIARRAAEIGDAQFETKIAAAETCFISWRLKSYAERAVVVAKSPD